MLPVAPPLPVCPSCRQRRRCPHRLATCARSAFGDRGFIRLLLRSTEAVNTRIPALHINAGAEHRRRAICRYACRHHPPIEAVAAARQEKDIRWALFRVVREVTSLRNRLQFRLAHAYRPAAQHDRFTREIIVSPRSCCRHHASAWSPESVLQQSYHRVPDRAAYVLTSIIRFSQFSYRLYAFFRPSRHTSQ